MPAFPENTNFYSMAEPSEEVNPSSVWEPYSSWPKYILGPDGQSYVLTSHQYAGMYYQPLIKYVQQNFAELLINLSG